MTYTVALTKSGQMTLPKALREFLGVDGAKSVQIEKTKDGVQIQRRLSDEEFFAKLDAMKSEKTKAAIRRNAGKTMSELRHEWAKSPAGKRYLERKYG